MESKDMQEEVEVEKPEKEKERLYIGSKLILASKMDEATFYRVVKKQDYNNETQPGYKVTYPDGYVSWSPEDVFETAYRKVTLREKALF